MSQMKVLPARWVAALLAVSLVAALAVVGAQAGGGLKTGQTVYYIPKDTLNPYEVIADNGGKLVLNGPTVPASGVYVIGTNAEVARFSGVDIARVKSILFLGSGLVSAMAGLFYAARLASVRGDAALFDAGAPVDVLIGEFAGMWFLEECNCPKDQWALAVEKLFPVLIS